MKMYILSSVTSKKLPNVYKICPKMISLEKLNILTPLQKLPKNVGDLGKLIIDKGFEKFPKVQSGHTGQEGKMKLRSIIKQLALNLLTSDYA